MALNASYACEHGPPFGGIEKHETGCVSHRSVKVADGPSVVLPAQGEYRKLNFSNDIKGVRLEWVVANRQGGLRPSKQKDVASEQELRRVILRRKVAASIQTPEAELGVADSGCPVWPDGIVGSYSHSGDASVAAWGRRNGLHALGVDLEASEALSSDASRIVTAKEDALFVRSVGKDYGRLLFSIKEAYYKAQYPITHEKIGFKKVVVLPGHKAGTWVVRRCDSDANPLEMKAGFAVIQGFVLSLVWLPALTNDRNTDAPLSRSSHILADFEAHGWSRKNL